MKKIVLILVFPLLFIFISCSETVNYLNLLFEDWVLVEYKISASDSDEEIESTQEYKKFTSDFELLCASEEYGNYLSVYFDNTHNYFVEYTESVKAGIENHDVNKIRLAVNSFEIIAKNQNSRASRYYLQIINIMLVILLLLFFFLFLIVQKYEKELDNSSETGIYAAFVVKEIEKERGRISKEIHDTVLQDLRYVQMETESLGLEESGIDGEKKKTLSEVLKKSIERLRKICQNLTPDELKNVTDDKTLIIALRNLCQRFEEQNNIPCVLSLQNNLQIGEIDFKVSMNVFRIIQESLNNIQKHAEATYVSVIVKNEESAGDKKGLNIIITDDGHGFDVNASVEKKHFGLSNMKARAKAIGARLYIQSDKDAGTSIKLVL